MARAPTPLETEIMHWLRHREGAVPSGELFHRFPQMVEPDVMAPEWLTWAHNDDYVSLSLAGHAMLDLSDSV